FGFLPASPPLLGVSLALGLGATSSDAEVARPGPAAILLNGEPALVLDGIDRITLNPLELLLWRALPPAGGRPPRYRQTSLDHARVQPQGIVLRYGAAQRKPDPAGRILTELPRRGAG